MTSDRTIKFPSGDQTDSNPRLPKLSTDLIDLLLRMVPGRYPRIGESPEQWQREAGARELVELLDEWRRVENGELGDA